ncbi:MAG: cob(I)yrinic acid a,c-diamide adenosyltransferase [Candidatus Aenigmatarchaeota archaeon]
MAGKGSGKKPKSKTKAARQFNGKRRGMVYLYTGTGAGKTTNALGIAMRCVGHRKRVVVIQFLKWWKNTGEYKIRNRLKPYYEIHQFGRKGWVGFKELDERDRRLAEKGFEFAKRVVKQKKPHVLILDEITIALNRKLLDKKKVIDFLTNLPPKTDVVLTGRYAPEELWDAADFVNIIVDDKHPKEMVAKPGIQY